MRLSTNTNGLARKPSDTSGDGAAGSFPGLPPAIAPRTISIKNVCEQTSLGRTSVWALVKAKRLRTVKVLGRTLVFQDSVDRLLAGDPNSGRPS